MFDFKKLWGNFKSTPQSSKYQSNIKDISNRNFNFIIKGWCFGIKI